MDLTYYLTRPLTYQELEWKKMDRAHKQRLKDDLTFLPKITSEPSTTVKGPAVSLVKPDLNKPVFLIDGGAAALIRVNRCPDCAQEIFVGNFKTDIQKKEYSISGKCVKCQELAFPN